MVEQAQRNRAKAGGVAEGWVVVSIVVTAVILLLVAWTGPAGIPFLSFGVDHVLRLLTSAILLALFIERTVLVMLLAWKGKDRAELARNMEFVGQRKRLELKEDKKVDADPEVQEAKEAYDVYRAESRQAGTLMCFGLGVIISALGVRLIEPLLDPRIVAEWNHLQYRLFAVVDVFITGALLGGGANGLHSILDWFQSAVDAQRHANKSKNPTATQ
jgi:hypothetical protein